MNKSIFLKIFFLFFLFFSVSSAISVNSQTLDCCRVSCTTERFAECNGYSTDFCSVCSNNSYYYYRCSQIPCVGLCADFSCNASCGANCTSLQDPDCAGFCCGDSICNGTETNSTCPGDCPLFCFDNDNDGYGNPASSACSVNTLDCNDNNSGIFPGAAEICDGIDNNCDGTVDESCACVNGQTQPCGISVGQCQAGVQTCTLGNWGSCVGEITPTAEICDGIDNDCDSLVDEEITKPLNDNQNGVCLGSLKSCSGASGWANNYSGVANNEWPNELNCSDGLDNDCDGLTDSADIVDCTSNCLTNSDCDDSNPCTIDVCGSGSCTYSNEINGTNNCGTGCERCWSPDNTTPSVCSSWDSGCDDSNECTVDACIADTCINNNEPSTKTCSGGMCDGLGSCMAGNVCVDNDNDGYGNPASNACLVNTLDCDDNNAFVNPGVIDICGNSIDEDCDGVDAQCSCTEEEVDDNQDGIFSTCGCNSCNGCLCDINNDDIADGVCLENNCNTIAPAFLDCGTDGCDATDKNKNIATSSKQGWSCDSSFNSFTNNYFTQDGISFFDGNFYGCADNNNYSYVAECAGFGGEFRQYLPDACSSSWCGDGALCDKTLDDGNFNPTGSCLSGACNDFTAEELVDANFDGISEFKTGGCNGDCNGCLCSIDGDSGPDGICVGNDCVTNSPVVLDCGDSCNTSDITSSAFNTCEGNEGKACSMLNANNPGNGTDLTGEKYFPQTSICGANRNPGYPATCFWPTNETCEHGGEYFNNCSKCSDGDLCDNNDGGNFNPNYGSCHNNVCIQANCTEELVDFDQDGTFSYCGCSSDSSQNKNGFACDTDGDLVGDGICVENNCVTTGPVSMPCFSDCQIDQYNKTYQGCPMGGYACDKDYLTMGQTFFEQDGVCADGSNTCVSSGDICQDDSGVFQNGCSNCADGDFCSPAISSGGNIDIIDKACKSGTCQQLIVPASFDWRNHNNKNWMTSVKDQSQCGGCWAFATAAVAEAKYNIQENNPDLDIDLSEQYLVSDCCSAGTCGGGDIGAASCGIVDEACSPYQSANSTCDGMCSDWSNRTWDISNTISYSATDIQTKKVIMTEGPVYARMYASNMLWDASRGYFTCSNPQGTNHAVVIVGWDDVGGYWIIKNSWGLGWSDGGYGKIAYGSCNLNGYAYISKVIAP